MAVVCGNLWDYNLAKVVVIDVTDDYRFCQPPLPSDFYPVLRETWMLRHQLVNRLPEARLVNGYLYDWHQTPECAEDVWYVGVVQEELANQLLAESGFQS